MNIKKFGLSKLEILEFEKKNRQQLSKKNKKEKFFLYNHQTLSDEEISNLERLINYNLPEEYKLFLKKNNGGYPDVSVLPTGRVVNFFLGFYNNMNIEYSIEWHINIYKNRYPNTMLPIASAGGGDLILIGLEKEYKSKIFYWDHNLEHEENGSNYYENITLVANSFNSFINLLKEEP